MVAVLVLMLKESLHIKSLHVSLWMQINNYLHNLCYLIQWINNNINQCNPHIIKTKLFRYQNKFLWKWNKVTCIKVSSVQQLPREKVQIIRIMKSQHNFLLVTYKLLLIMQELKKLGFNNKHFSHNYWINKRSWIPNIADKINLTKACLSLLNSVILRYPEAL